jgi:hypothetical protein
MQRWEYAEVAVVNAEWADTTGESGKAEPVSDFKASATYWRSVTDRLNALGADGWEVAAAVATDGELRYVLKRPVE